MKYNIELIFIIFPLICLFFHMSKLKNNKIVFFVLTVLFVFIYSFSLNGSDISGYEMHYNYVEKDATPSENGQEVGYFYLMKLFVKLGINYIWFRVIFLTFLSVFLFVMMRKFTDDFPLALFFVSSMFVIYTISAYRQYIVIVFSFFWLYMYCQGKKKMAIIGTGLLLLFHVTAILPLLCMVFEYYNTNKRAERVANIVKKYLPLLLIFVIALRILVVLLLKDKSVNLLIERILKGHASADPTMFSFGLLSRLVFLLLITYMYNKSHTDDKKIILLYWYYSISMLLYLIVPLELLMGRLMNNAYIFGAVLIPMLKKEIVQRNRQGVATIELPMMTMILFLLELVAFVVLINQLLNQNGYTPYLNILFGDSVSSFPIEV